MGQEFIVNLPKKGVYTFKTVPPANNIAIYLTGGFACLFIFCLYIFYLRKPE